MPFKPPLRAASVRGATSTLGPCPESTWNPAPCVSTTSNCGRLPSVTSYQDTDPSCSAAFSLRHTVALEGNGHALSDIQRSASQAARHGTDIFGLQTSEPDEAATARAAKRNMAAIRNEEVMSR